MTGVIFSSDLFGPEMHRSVFLGSLSILTLLSHLPEAAGGAKEDQDVIEAPLRDRGFSRVIEESRLPVDDKRPVASTTKDSSSKVSAAQK